ncbi:hypothetical protein K402DRAFT_465408 [Aulographum hederae CBS 113979]|uniref:G-protein coupled receptors family 2 profile 2 domain-containing protein n=1 Tax=Aulographum hederae CBS 113979 TaxID=1176131 RepID=A0A6G1GTL4_9PEZI|nr:hypothetical protein K402DRAFT_465408 [Aulographum hederae CBS 113979]
MGHDHAIELTERCMSVISLLGTLFIICSFAACPSFRKPINRLVVYASFGNIMSNVATTVSIDGLRRGTGSSLCQFQGFMIQMFMPADSLWTFCMALNVYLTFFRKYRAADLRKLEIWYCLLCYGLPLIPALVFLCLDATTTANIYGDATIWCWVSTKWDWMRIAFFYGPVWVVILLTTSIYIITGKTILKQRAAIRDFNRFSRPHLAPTQTSWAASNAVHKITQIQISSEARPSYDLQRAAISCFGSKGTSIAGSDSRLGCSSSMSEREQRNLARFSTFPEPSETSGSNSTNKTRLVVESGGGPSNVIATVTVGTRRSAEALRCLRSRATQAEERKKASIRAKSLAWDYAKVSMLMFVAICIVWQMQPLRQTLKITIPSPETHNKMITPLTSSPKKKIPSTINRLYSLARPHSPPLFGLSIIAAAVLPLQGFWNFAIYTMTLKDECRAVWRRLVRRCRHGNDSGQRFETATDMSEMFSPSTSALPSRAGSSLGGAGRYGGYSGYQGSSHSIFGSGSMSHLAVPLSLPLHNHNHHSHSHSHNPYTHHRTPYTKELTLREAMDMDPDVDEDADEDDEVAAGVETPITFPKRVLVPRRADEPFWNFSRERVGVGKIGGGGDGEVGERDGGEGIGEGNGEGSGERDVTRPVDSNSEPVAFALMECERTFGEARGGARGSVDGSRLRPRD